MVMKAQANIILLVIFVLGIVVETYYISSFLVSQTSLDDVLEKTFIVGVLTSILIVLAIIIIRQNDLVDRLSIMGFKQNPRTSREVRKELAHLYRDLGALKIVSNDNLMKESEYNRKKAALDVQVLAKKKELQVMESQGN
jgi:hypothetical protein